jgi:glycerophosphoryl diester phosphodiesterase
MDREPDVPRAFDDTPVLCGHRGCGRGIVDGHGENTLASFLAAAEAGLRWVEVDARITADDQLVARHDPVLADGRFVAELSVAETDAAGLMRLEALFAALPTGVAVDVDVKSSLEDALRPRERTTAALVAELVARETDRRRLLVTSFDPAALLIVRERAPAVPIGLLTWLRFPLRKAVAAAAHLGADVVGPHFESFPLHDARVPAFERDAASTVAVAHAAGLQVLAWCPDPGDADLLTAAGVDALVVDEAPAAVRQRS